MVEYQETVERFWRVFEINAEAVARGASPEEIEWTVLQDPSYAYAYRIMGSVDINGRPYTSSYIAEPGDGKEQQVIDEIKSLIMGDIRKAMQ